MHDIRFKILRLDAGTEKFIPLLKDRARNLVSLFKDIDAFSRTYLFGSVSAVLHMVRFDKETYIARISMIGSAALYPSVLVPLTAYLSYVDVTSVKLFDDDSSGDPVVPVGATALASRCSVTIAPGQAVGTPYTQTREFLEWCLENRLYGFVQVYFPTEQYVLKSNGAAADFLHPFPHVRLRPEYFEKENGVWYCYASMSGYSSPTYQKFQGDLSTTAPNAEAAQIDGWWQIKCTLGTENSYGTTSEYNRAVFFKFAVFDAFDVSHGNAEGVITFPFDNPTYTFDVFGQSYTVALDPAVVQAALSGNPEEEGIEDGGELAGVGTWALLFLSARRAGNTVTARVTPIVRVNRGEYWYENPGDVPFITPDLFGAAQPLDGEFIDLRQFLNPSNPEYVIPAMTISEGSAAAFVLNRGINVYGLGAGTIGEAAFWTETKITADLFAGLFGTHAIVSNDTSDWPTSVIYAGSAEVAGRYSNGMFAFLPPTAVGTYNLTIVPPTPPAFVDSTYFTYEASSGLFAYNHLGQRVQYGEYSYYANYALPFGIPTGDPADNVAIASAEFTSAIFPAQTQPALGGVDPTPLWPAAREYNSSLYELTVVYGSDASGFKTTVLYKGQLIEEQSITPTMRGNRVIDGSSDPAPFSGGSTFGDRAMAFSTFNYLADGIRGIIPLQRFLDVPNAEAIASSIAADVDVRYGAGTMAAYDAAGYMYPASPAIIFGTNYDWYTWTGYGILFAKDIYEGQNGFALIELYVGDIARTFLSRGHSDALFFETLQSYVADKAVLDEWIAANQVRVTVNAGFLAAVAELDAHIAGLGDATTLSKEQWEALREKHLAALRASHRVVVNNFASAKLLDLIQEGATHIVEVPSRQTYIYTSAPILETDPPVDPDL